MYSLYCTVWQRYSPTAMHLITKWCYSCQVFFGSLCCEESKLLNVVGKYFFSFAIFLAGLARPDNCPPGKGKIFILFVL